MQIKDLSILCSSTLLFLDVRVLFAEKKMSVFDLDHFLVVFGLIFWSIYLFFWSISCYHAVDVQM